jgi:hypothetical protein
METASNIDPVLKDDRHGLLTLGEPLATLGELAATLGGSKKHIESLVCSPRLLELVRRVSYRPASATRFHLGDALRELAPHREAIAERGERCRQMAAEDAARTAAKAEAKATEAAKVAQAKPVAVRPAAPSPGAPSSRQRRVERSEPEIIIIRRRQA